jgi:L-seryl-tRNA(Ser) seleniumtransferase
MRGVHKPRPLPAVGRLVNLPAYARLQDVFPRPLVVEAIREQLEAERAGAAAADDERPALVEARLRAWSAPGLTRVINGTGVILHTNLGRAPLSAAAVSAVSAAAASYSDLELDLGSGRRGARGAVLEALLLRLTGAGAALVVNNNAAAVLLMLTALCRDREVIVSRGQQVEIGGSFRMPDVMKLSGARMVEVGTTNRTRPADYADAAGERTAALLRVHTSNFRVTGFAESVSLEEMSKIARERGLLLLDDLGSGALDPILDEPDVISSVRLADVVTFSGDKLLGGPQAGIALGKPELIRKMARHPLARALRAGKLTLAALEATLRQRLLGRLEEIPVERMLRATRPELRHRAAFWMVKLADRDVPSRLLEGESAAGGGSLPGQALPTVLLALEGPASRLTAALRRGEPPVLARIEADSCCIDPRTVLKGEDEILVDALEAAYRSTLPA